MARRIAVLVALAVFCAAGAAAAQDKEEGKKIYVTYCSACHGDSGKGDGPSAAALPVKPANHTDGNVMNKMSDKTLMDIISKGGQAAGKSAFMPAWGSSLRDKQIADIVAYLRSIANPPYKPGGK
ncbi:MAG TPA: cytochrome c [Candidatus Binatia bacterium]|nr:cytochrome c [Candidatus Binatia bacterium]